MKKTLVSLVVMGLLGLITALSSALAAIHLQLDVRQQTGEITIYGSTSRGSGQQVTVWVQSPEGTVDYINQASSGPEGEFSFSYTVESGKTGTYTVMVGGSGVENPTLSTFYYTGAEEPQEPGLPEEPGKPEEPQEPGAPEEPGTPEEPQEPGNPENPDTDDNRKPGFGGALPEVSRGEMNETEQGVTYIPGPAAMRNSRTEDGKALSIATLSPYWVESALETFSKRKLANPVLVVKLGEEQAVHLELPSEALQLAMTYSSPVTLSLVTPYGHYDLPLSILKDNILESDALILGIELKDLDERWLLAQANSFATPYGLHYVVGLKRNGGLEEVADFGNVFIRRGIVLQSDVDPRRTTGVLVDNSTGTFHFVPSIFHRKDGNPYASLMRNGNSIYTVVHNNKSFQDIQTHWAKDDIELLASKLIVNGRSENLFAPSEQVTRAEFTAMLVRALGIVPDGSGELFQDVQSTDWFASTVAAAVQKGLVQGYEDSTFRPFREITREEMAAMLIRTIQYTEFMSDSPQRADSPEGALNAFDDRPDISLWARDYVAEAVNYQLINGRSPTAIVPQGLATRAETAVMIKRTLQFLAFINE